MFDKVLLYRYATLHVLTIILPYYENVYNYTGGSGQWGRPCSLTLYEDDNNYSDGNIDAV